MTTILPAPLPPPLIETILHRAPLDVLLFDTELMCRYAVLADGAVAETVTLGNDGIAGLGLYLGSETTLARTFCQVPGDALRLPAAVFREAGGIDYRRGQLQIVDRDALLAAACECYQVIREQPARLLT